MPGALPTTDLLDALGQALQHPDATGAFGEAVALLAEAFGSNELSLVRRAPSGEWPPEARATVEHFSAHTGQAALWWADSTHFAWPFVYRETLCAVLMGEGGEPSAEVLGRASVLISMAVTLRDQTSSDLHADGERLRLALLGHTGGVWELDYDTRRAWLSKEVFDALGLTGERETVTFDVLHQRVHPDDVRLWVSATTDALRHFSRCDVVVRMRHESGNWVFSHVRAIVMRSKNGVPTRIAGSFTDISPQRELERSVSRAREINVFMSKLVQANSAAQLDDLVTTGVSRLLHCEAVALVYPGAHPATWDLRLQAVAFGHGELARGAAFDPLFAKSEASLEFTLTPDHPEPLLVRLSELGFSHVTALPLDTGERVVAVLLVLHRAGALDEEAHANAAQLAALVAVKLERIRGLEHLEMSQRRLEDAQALAQVGSWETDLHTGLTEWSAQLCAMYGLPAKATVMRTEEARAHEHPADRNAVNEDLALLAVRDTPVQCSTRVFRVDGSVMHTQSMCRLIRDASGQPLRVQGVTRDITSEVQARAKLENALASARRYQTLFSLSTSLPAVLDRNGHFVDTAPGWSASFGWRADDLLGQPVARFAHEDDALATSTALQGLSATTNFTNRFRARDGTYKWLAWTVTFDSNSEQVYALAHDVTALKETDERLKKSEEFLQQTGALAHVGGWEMRAGESGFWSEELNRIFGLQPGTRPTEEQRARLFAAPVRTQLDAALAECWASGKPFDMTVPTDTPHGQRWVRVIGQANWRDDHVDHVSGALQDVTQQHRASEAALAASRAKSQFLANTSHEIRTRGRSRSTPT